MGIIQKPHTFVGDTKAKASEVNATFDALYNEFNGSVDENNINMTKAEFKTALLDTLKTVDGAGSGLDADLLDGREISSEFDSHTGDVAVHLNQENVEDIINGLLSAGNDITLSYDDVNNNLSISVDTSFLNADTVDGEHASAIVTNARVKSYFPDTITNILSDHNTTVHNALNIDADTVDGKHYIDIQNWVNTSADVPNADYADNAGNADYADNAGNAANAGSLENNTIVDILKKGYPVGSIYINANNGTNPATLLGFGTWERFGEGRVLVSQDSTDADFDAIGETGGEKTHQLTVDEMPSHNHNYTRVSGGAGGGGLNVDGSTSTAYTSLAGGDFPHNNLQPYITVYMWKRTA